MPKQAIDLDADPDFKVVLVEKGRRGTYRQKEIKKGPELLKPAVKPGPSTSSSGAFNQSKVASNNGNQWDNQPSGIDIDHGHQPQEGHRQGKSQNDYLREYLPRRSQFLDVLLEEEAPYKEQRCTMGCGRLMNWRCLSCCGRGEFCSFCLRETHRRLPFHKIEQWDEPRKTFRSVSLAQIGIKVYLGHHGNPCPVPVTPKEAMNLKDGKQDPTVADLGQGNEPDLKRWKAAFDDLEGEPIDEEVYEDDDVADEDDVDIEAIDPILDKQLDGEGNPIVVVVDSTGVHKIPFHYCTCSNEADQIEQLLRIGFFPASFCQIRTVFTFDVLDDFLIDNQECQTSGYHYFAKLQRRTSSAFPHKVPHRYRELLRISRKWRNLKQYKWHGLGHTGKEPSKGELALFCPTCPQPGINIPDNWKEHSDPYLYMRSFVMDGNFTANHLLQKRPEDDVILESGTGFMTDRHRYKEHLKNASDDREINDCNATRALNAKVLQAGTTATGIGATACARHGCFCPSSVVDFQKGERQANMDYSASEALMHSNIGDIEHILLIYDVICQWIKRLLERFGKSEYLTLPTDKIIHSAIGSFHVRGHVPHCFYRYALLFVRGAGLIDGEILETLWSVLNHISPTTRGASEAHRDEILNDQMNYSNWKKAVGMGATLAKKYLRVVVLLDETEKAFDKFTATIKDASLRDEWVRKADELQERRLQDVSIMDWFGPQMKKDAGRQDVELRIAETETQTLSPLLGLASTLSEGLVIEEEQVQVRAYSRSLGTSSTTKQRLELNTRRQKLATRLQDFHQSLFNLFPEAFRTITNMVPADKDVSGQKAVWEHVLKVVRLANVEFRNPEDRQLFLPSNLGDTFCRSPETKVFVATEIDLRTGQASDLLESLREELGRKAFFFVKNRKAPNKAYKTRGWSAIHTTDEKINGIQKTYLQVRKALKALHAHHTIMSKYQDITSQDLKISTELLDTSLPGQRHGVLPWFWSLETGENVQDSNTMLEFRRTHWLRAREQLARLKEEKLLIENEMIWTAMFFQYKSRKWQSIIEEYPNLSQGHHCYARRQSVLWMELADEANFAFTKAKKGASKLVQSLNS